MKVIRQTDGRRSETPNGVMTTLASPTQGGAERSLWRVDVPGDVQGPAHAIDVEQIWTFVAGSATVRAEGEAVDVAAGDTIVLDADLERRLIAGADGFTAIVTGSADGRATVADKPEKIVPPWIL